MDVRKETKQAMHRMQKAWDKLPLLRDDACRKTMHQLGNAIDAHEVQLALLWARQDKETDAGVTTNPRSEKFAQRELQARLQELDASYENRRLLGKLYDAHSELLDNLERGKQLSLRQLRTLKATLDKLAYDA